jgi:hypothetical protein
MSDYRLRKSWVTPVSPDRKQEQIFEAERLRFQAMRNHIDTAIKLALEQWTDNEYAFVAVMNMVGARHAEYQKSHPAPPRAKQYTKQVISKELRWQVWERDNFTCRRCGTRQNLEVDHIHPERKGGKATLDNLQTLCKSCNTSKKDRLVGEDWYE